MKKILILFILLFSFYLTKALFLDLSGGDILYRDTLNNIGNTTDKINLSSNNLNINGKLVSTGKICAGNLCLGKCNAGKIWDTATSSCLAAGKTKDTAGLSCKDLYDNYNIRTDGIYYIKPTGYIGEAFQVYCDMTTDGGGWTYLLPPNFDISGLSESDITANWLTVTPLFVAHTGNVCGDNFIFQTVQDYSGYQSYVCGDAEADLTLKWNNSIGATQIRFSAYSGGNNSYINLNGNSVYNYSSGKNKFALGDNTGVCDVSYCYTSGEGEASLGANNPLIKTIPNGEITLSAGGIADSASWAGYGFLRNVAIK